MNLSKLYKAALLAVAVHNCYSAERNYVEINSFNNWNYDSEVDTNTFGSVGTQLPNYFDAYTKDGSKVIFSAAGPMFRTEDGFLYLLDNEKIIIDPENLVKGIGVDVYTQLPGKYYFDFTALNTNDNVIANVEKTKTFVRAAFQPGTGFTNRVLTFGIESFNVDIDKFIISVENLTNKVKKFSIDNIRMIEKISSSTNNITIIEGLPYALTSNMSGRFFNWYKDGEFLLSGTNNFLKMDFAVEGDEGTYTVQSGGSSMTFNVSFKRTIKVFINDFEVNNYYDEKGRIQISQSSKIKLVPFIEGLPIRYTIDGSEPTEKSPFYTGPFVLDKTTYVRAKIDFPETDATRINVTGGSN